MKAAMLLLAVLLIGSPLGAQDVHLTKAQASGDVVQLISLLESTHPDPYSAFGGKIEFKRAAQALVAAVPDSGMTRDALDALIRPFVVTLRDGHTFISGPGRWRDPEPRFATRFGVAADGVFLAAHDVAALDGALGWKVLAVNGVPLDTLAARYNSFPLENAYGRYMIAAGILRAQKPMRIVLRDDAPTALRLSLQAADGHVEQREVPWNARAASPTSTEGWRQPPVQWAERRPTSEVIESALLAGGTAGYLRIGQIMTREAFELSWHMNPESTKPQIAQWYQMRSREMPADPVAAIAAMPSLTDTTVALLRLMKARRVGALIVDLRDNDGGFTGSAYPMLYALYGDAFAAATWPGEYVTVQSPLYIEKSGSTVEERRKQDPGFEVGRYEFSHESAPANPAFEVGRYEFSHESAPANPAAARQKQLEEWRKAGYSWVATLDALKGQPVYHPERVLVLVNQGTYSAAFHIMMLFRQLGATIVGVPSRQSPNTFMEMTPFTLPASGIAGSISNSYQTMLPDQPHAQVVQPDFPVTLAVFQRYGADQESVLRYALELLKQGKIAAR